MKPQAKVGAADAAVGSAVSLGVGIWRGSTDAVDVEFIDPSDAGEVVDTVRATKETPDAATEEMPEEATGAVQDSVQFPSYEPVKLRGDERSVKRKAAKASSSSFVGIGDEAPEFELEDRLGIPHKLSSYRGRKVLLSFFRFAACPTSMCRMDEMQKQYDMLKRGGITVICVFNSVPDMINNFAANTSSVVALSDRDKKAYRLYRINEPTKAFFQYEAEVFGKPQKYKPYSNWKFMKRDFHLGGVRICPADFLIDEAGRIVDLFRAEDPAKHHIPFERLEAFIPEGRRCKCNNGDCWTVRCRENHARQTKEEKNDLRNRRTAVVGQAIAQ